MNCEDLDQSIPYLIQDWSSVKPKEATLGNLIRALKAESFNDVAGMLFRVLLNKTICNIFSLIVQLESLFC